MHGPQTFDVTGTVATFLEIKVKLNKGLVCENSCMFCNAEYADLTSDQRVLRVLAWLMSDDCCGFDEVVQDQVSDSFTGRHACNTTRPHHICYAETGTRLFDEKYAPFERTSSRPLFSSKILSKKVLQYPSHRLVYVTEKYCSGWKFTIVYDKH